jgi:hypothetical protein
MNAALQTKRWWFWIPLLGLVTYLAFYGDKSPSSSDDSMLTAFTLAQRTASTIKAVTTNPATKSAKSTTVGSSVITTLDLLIPRDTLIVPRKASTSTGKQLFASGSWTPLPPPVKPIPVLPPPPPMAPTLPFAFIGKKLEAGAWEVFLSRGEQSFVAKEGSLIDNTYRIDKIAPPNLSLTYLPLGQSQNLSIGASE